jgi:transposase InsO family protein
MVYQFMREHKNQYSIRETAAIFGVSSSAYYKWAEQGVSAGWKERDAELPVLIREIVVNHHFRYGSPRVREALPDDYGIRISRKKTARLMRENGLNARRRGKFIPTTDSNHGLPVCENRLNREFHAEQAGEQGVSDILRVLGGWIYLTAVLDLYDRKLIGWALSSDMETVHTAIPALHLAFTNRTPREGLLFPSDRGVQYCAKSFRALLQEYCPTVRQSMR